MTDLSCEFSISTFRVSWCRDWFQMSRVCFVESSYYWMWIHIMSYWHWIGLKLLKDKLSSDVTWTTTSTFSKKFSNFRSVLQLTYHWGYQENFVHMHNSPLDLHFAALNVLKASHTSLAFSMWISSFFLHIFIWHVRGLKSCWQECGAAHCYITFGWGGKHEREPRCCK